MTLQRHPSILRALGLRREIGFGARFVPILAVLVRLRRLRGTGVDPFGATRMRRLERELVREYEQIIDAIAPDLSADNNAAALALARAAEEVHGYENIKRASIERYHAKLERLRREFAGASQGRRGDAELLPA